MPETEAHYVANDGRRLRKPGNPDVSKAAPTYDELVAALQVCHAHLAELRQAWGRGAIDENDGKGGTRSNRNAELEVKVRTILRGL